MSRPLRIAIMHPELGIGGAERLVVDAATALRARGHTVVLFTARHDPARSFEAARNGSLDVRVYSRAIPLHLGGRLRLPLAVARMARLAHAVGDAAERFDAVICDTVAQSVPLLRRLARAPVVFYCHFPDQLLTPPRHGWYRLYRIPLDRWEERGLDRADRVLVNSAYTGRAFRQVYRTVRQSPEILYPAVALDDAPAAAPPGGCSTIAVISRFDPGKNLVLAVEAYAALRDLLPPERFAATRLVLAGAVDVRLREGRDTVAALRARAAALGVAAQVSVHESPTDAARLTLLRAARCVVYTPLCEHFGYVPIEAMAAGRPVLAVAAGGPTETVVHGETGWLLEPTPAAFAAALRQLFDDPALSDRMGRAARNHVERNFSMTAFGERLEAIVRVVVAQPISPPRNRRVDVPV